MPWFGPIDSSETIMPFSWARRTDFDALEGGYFEIPRETNSVELAAVLDTSDQSLNERLRRAQSRLFGRLLLTDADTDSGVGPGAGSGSESGRETGPGLGPDRDPGSGLDPRSGTDSRTERD